MTQNSKALAKAYAAAFPNMRPWSDTEIEALIATEGVICIGDEFCFLIARLTLDEAEIITLATEPAYRRQGRARLVLRALEEQIRGTALSVFLEVDEDNAAARSLYRACDYRQIGLRRGYYKHSGKPPTNALVLRKKLT